MEDGLLGAVLVRNLHSVAKAHRDKRGGMVIEDYAIEVTGLTKLQKE